MLLNNKHYYNLPPQERKNLWKHYKKVYPNMGYTDMVKHFNGEVENYQFGGRTDYFDSDVKKFADGGTDKPKVNSKILSGLANNIPKNRLEAESREEYKRMHPEIEAANFYNKIQKNINQTSEIYQSGPKKGQPTGKGALEPSYPEMMLMPGSLPIKATSKLGEAAVFAAEALNPIGGVKNLKSNVINKSASSTVQNIKTSLADIPKPTPEAIKDAKGFLERREFIKNLQKEGFIGKEFNLNDVNYAARNTDKTNKLTKLALEAKATRFRGVKGKVPKDGKGVQEYTGYKFDMSKPAWNNEISQFEHMKQAGVNFDDPISIAKYQASHIPMEQYGYRAGMPYLTHLDALYVGNTPTNYGNYQIKMSSPRDFSTGNYKDWFNKYHNPKNNIEDLAVKDGHYIIDFVPNTSYEMPVGLSKTNMTSVVGKRGQKMFDVDESFPYMDYKNLPVEKELEFINYKNKLNRDFNTGWKGQYKNGGLVK